MVRLFNHWFPTNTVLQVVFDVVMLFGAAIVALLWLSHGQLPDLDQLWPPALLFAVAMMAVNAALGLYQRRAQRSVGQTTARVLLSLTLTVPDRLHRVQPVAAAERAARGAEAHRAGGAGRDRRGARPRFPQPGAADAHAPGAGGGHRRRGDLGRADAEPAGVGPEDSRLLPGQLGRGRAGSSRSRCRQRRASRRDRATPQHRRGGGRGQGTPRRRAAAARIARLQARRASRCSTCRATSSARSGRCGSTRCTRAG